MGRLQRFLFSRRNLVGSVLAGVGVALHLLGLLTGPFWLTIVVGMYLAGVLLGPKERGLDVRVDAAAGNEEIREGLNQLVKAINHRVAMDIQIRVESIRASILVALDAEPDRAAGDPTAHLIRQTALDYLPEALNGYLRLPRAYAERRPVAAGRTPHDVLLEQSNLLDTKMREAADAILAHDSERLLANGRFLADRFQASSLRLEGPEAGPGPAPAPAEAAERVAEAVPQPTSPPDATADAAERERVR